MAMTSAQYKIGYVDLAAWFGPGHRNGLWVCEDCGWQWPLKDAPYQDAECDACSGTMRKLRPEET